MTKTELEERYDALVEQNYALEDELFELRGLVPDFPSAVTTTAEYVSQFNLMRHFK